MDFKRILGRRSGGTPGGAHRAGSGKTIPALFQNQNGIGFFQPAFSTFCFSSFKAGNPAFDRFRFQNRFARSEHCNADCKCNCESQHVTLDSKNDWRLAECLEHSHRALRRCIPGTFLRRRGTTCKGAANCPCPRKSFSLPLSPGHCPTPQRLPAGEVCDGQRPLPRSRGQLARTRRTWDGTGGRPTAPSPKPCRTHVDVLPAPRTPNAPCVVPNSIPHAASRATPSRSPRRAAPTHDPVRGHAISNLQNFTTSPSQPR